MWNTKKKQPNKLQTVKTATWQTCRQWITGPRKGHFDENEWQTKGGTPALLSRLNHARMTQE